MNNTLKNKQIIFIIYVALVGYGIVNLPRDVAEAGGTGGWVSLIIVFLIAIIDIVIITYLSYVYEGKNLFDYIEKLTGKFLGYIITTIYFVYFFLLYSYITRIYTETVKITLLTRTPSWTMGLFFFIVVYYALSKGIRVVARICQIYGVVNILGNTFMSIILFTQGKMINLRPFFSGDEIVTYLKGIKEVVFAFLGLEILLIIPVTRENKRNNLLLYTLSILGIVAFLYFMVSESAISVIGANTVVLYKASVFNIVRGIDVPYLEILRRLDGIYIIIWTFNIFCNICIWGYGVNVAAKKILSRVNDKYILLISTTLAFIIGNIPTSTNQIEKLLEYNGYIGYGTTFVIPIILLIITKVKKYDKKTL